MGELQGNAIDAALDPVNELAIGSGYALHLVHPVCDLSHLLVCPSGKAVELNHLRQLAWQHGCNAYGPGADGVDGDLCLGCDVFRRKPWLVEQLTQAGQVCARLIFGE